MSFHFSKPGHRPRKVGGKRMTPALKGLERLSLGFKEKPAVPIEEIRRQGLKLAGRGLGQGMGSPPPSRSRA
ncbi:MAG: hypothetical protein C4293_09465 [Nitrospiraceae bacterium]